MNISKKLFILIGFATLIFCSMGSAFFISLTKSPATLSQEYLQLSYVAEEHARLIYMQKALSYAPYTPSIWQAVATELSQTNDNRIDEALIALSNLDAEPISKSNKVAFLNPRSTE